jgi:hypothetical protein
MSSNEDWHLQKSVPLTLVFALMVQAVALVWFFAELDSNIEANQTQAAQHDARISSLESLVQGQAVSLARIDENIRHIRTTVDRVLAEGE